MCCHCLLIEGDDRLILVDTGLGVEDVNERGGHAKLGEARGSFCKGRFGRAAALRGHGTQRKNRLQDSNGRADSSGHNQLAGLRGLLAPRLSKPMSVESDSAH